MAMLQVIQRGNDVYDAVVVGSGATGGVAAKQLAEAGMRVAVLEAGPKITPADFTEHTESYQLPYRGQSPEILRDRPIQGLCYACRESNYKWFVNDIKNPYTTADGKPFRWIRMRILGGRSLSWGRQSYRMGDIDFKCADRDGYGENWPVSYNDLVPYYETVEKFIGISGREEGLDQLPDSVFLPPMGMTCGEELFRDRVKQKLGRTITIGRVAVLTRDHNGRAACHYCGPCEQGCVTHSYYHSPWVTLAAAEKTGRCTVVTDAVVSHVVRDAQTGLAGGVAYIDRVSRQPRELRAKVVVLCASTLESTRILLNSEPGGMANSSGALGHYLMDHIYQGGASGELPDLKAAPWSGMPRRPNGIYIPRFRNIDRPDTNGMIRGYGFQGGSSAQFNMGARGFGADFKNAVRDTGLWRTGITAWCECLPRYENYAEIDTSRTDAWGIPTLKIHMDWSDNEKKLWQDSREQAAEMLEASGHKNVRMTGRISDPGFCIHEVGTARMGADPRKSVLNGYAQTHDVKNLFVTDGAAYASIGCQNPTLTMMAITARACDYIADQQGKGNLA
jgi:choline dehydrogenase-like flavoprotein